MLLTSVLKSMNLACSIFSIQLASSEEENTFKGVYKYVSVSTIILHRSILLSILDKIFKSQQGIRYLPFILQTIILNSKLAGS